MAKKILALICGSLIFACAAPKNSTSATQHKDRNTSLTSTDATVDPTSDTYGEIRLCGLVCNRDDNVMEWVDSCLSPLVCALAKGDARPTNLKEGDPCPASNTDPKNLPLRGACIQPSSPKIY